ncbi:MAG: Na(+)-translocating NADH-quinone reductase subunit A [Myxococcota bacterium]|nr:NADH:ubiquinone reductase (Na(+)-transporting) subunit A [Spirochaeta sp.]RPG13940.1 MAG: Na(+)-translocating NADH-quinone reductase subunit A [Proteobacteria bacterium TMED72]
MASHKITKGLDLPISGAPLQVIRERRPITRVAVVADDFPGMKPRMLIEEGDNVLRGQPLFLDRKNEGVIHTAPGAGRVIGIHRGERRALQTVVIDLSDGERSGETDAAEFQEFESYTGKAEPELSRDEIRDLLVESGQWTAFRTRPFSRTPAVDSQPLAIFVTAIDTAPLAPLPEVALEGRMEDFSRGLRILARLTEGKTYLCMKAHSDLTSEIEAPVSLEYFEGPHPAGTPGLHIHLLEPVSRNKAVWHIGYADVAAIGHLFSTGQLDVDRVFSIAGPLAKDPRLVRARLGASTDDLARDDIPAEIPTRCIAGSVLSGKRASEEAFSFMGRFERQVSLIREDRDRHFLGWLTPGAEKFSVLRLFSSALRGKKNFDMTTNMNGAERFMVPVGSYERVMPMDIIPTFLLRSMMAGDLEKAEQLGALELDEEDLALCTFVCHSKIDYGPILRRNLELIESEG